VLEVMVSGNSEYPIYVITLSPGRFPDLPCVISVQNFGLDVFLPLPKSLASWASPAFKSGLDGLRLPGFFFFSYWLTRFNV